MSPLRLVPFALFGGLVAGYGPGIVVELLPLFGAILLLYALLAVIEIAGAIEVRRQATQRRPQLTMRH